MSEENKQNNDISKREEEILDFWNKNDIFKKSENKDSPKGEFTFYDGPPFATGLPHYGHILAGTIKDTIPRYKTMQGYRVSRKWGWDCHGLPLENEIERELNLETKRDIEAYGIEKFNKKARNSVLRYADDWKRIIPRMGRWVDMEHDYKTMDTTYTESVWWVFKTLYDKKLIYEGFKSMHLCPRCETTLSNFEVSQGYKDITDFAVTVKLELVDEKNTYLLVWTTTAWTLPGNMAAAVNKDKTYVKILKDKNKLILAKDRLEIVEGEYKILEEFSGWTLIGKKYKPPFDYYKNAKLSGKENAWKVYHAPYVGVEEGTGLVHLAPAYGEEDMELAKEKKIPLVHHVGTDGKFKKEVKDFAGLSVKPKENPQQTDIEIIKNLAHRKLLFSKEKITHSYPHCWRCDTPLLNYASSSWFVKVTSFKNKLVAQNKKIHWVPKEVGSRRFGKWLEGARDWAISRSRYWGAPIPVWRNKKTKEIEVVGSVEELKKKVVSSGNRYFVMRHGESESNINNIISSLPDNDHKLTTKGKEISALSAHFIKGKKIDYIITSPFVRTKETADIVAKEIGILKKDIIKDSRVGEINLGELNNKPISAYKDFAATYEERFTKKPQGGENLADMKSRIGEFLYDIENKYKRKNILIITHEYGAWLLSAVSNGADVANTIELMGKKNNYIKTGEIKEFSFVPLPHNSDYELDLHRPSIDTVTLTGSDGEVLERVPEVFDCWFESGSMPYGQFHYPFENKDKFNPKSGLFRKSKGFPADFIAEGMDQTRGWFYSLIVLGTALFGKSPYKNVIVNGTVLTEDGQKMSKRLKNYPDPMDVIHKYGADSIRYYFLSSPIMRGEDLNFSEAGVAEVMRKIIIRLSNVLSFYELYRDDKDEKIESTNILDKWILSRLNQLISEVTEYMDKYELDRATRPIATFVEDLSIWYLRRSRGRFKGEDKKDKARALETTKYVLGELSKIMAPFTPFFAEELYQKLHISKDGKNERSVHLESWPKEGEIDFNILKEMKEIRTIVSIALEARAEAGIKVRQPLQTLRIKNREIENKEELEILIKDEINVKEVIFDDLVTGEILLDTKITDELREEGIVRDLIRHVQELRKKKGLTPESKVALKIKTGDIEKELVEKFKEIIVKTAILSGVEYSDNFGEEVTIGMHVFTIDLY